MIGVPSGWDWIAAAAAWDVDADRLKDEILAMLKAPKAWEYFMPEYAEELVWFVED